MSKIYNHTQIEEKWLQYWEKNKLFFQTDGQEVKTDEKVESIKNKMYLLFAFAYPSGQGLHVGHVESKTALDILARYYRMNGKSVFFPVGWDAFGLPAENYAIKTSIPPVETTKNAINTFRRQIKRLGISYDWANEIATCHPGYYKWTQWLFLQLYQAGLAYRDTGMVNWCPSCQTVLANEQVVDGACERCETEVIQKEMEQWFFKITDYKDELIEGLDQVDWPEPTKKQQLNWIGKKEGAEIDFIVVTPEELKKLDKKAPKVNSNVSLTKTLDKLELVMKKWYQEQLVGSRVYAPILKDEVVFSREIWEHLNVKDRSQSERLFRLLAIPKIYSVLSSPHAIMTTREKITPDGTIKFWSLEEFVDGAVVKVVIRQFKHDKHVYSIMWRGENEDSFEAKRSRWQQKHEDHQNKHKKKKLSRACYPHPQGINTLQLPFFNHNYTQKLEVLSRLLEEFSFKHWLEEDLMVRTKNWATQRLSCFTTRPDTVFGVTFVVISPEKFKELKLIKQILEKKRVQVEKYLEKAFKKTQEERQIGERDKAGVDTGLKAINPVNGQAVPVYVADYVLGGVGTGAVMGVPAHDKRDFAFAKKHGLEIRPVISWGEKDRGGEEKKYDINAWQNFYADYGQMINSGKFNGVSSEDALAALVEEFAYAIRPTITYKLRDWLISRQRYWGTPIPIVYDPEGKPHPVKEKHLPWELPTDVDFKPTGESPLRSSQELKARTEKLYGKGWTPEYDTMDTFVDSSWYYLRYVSSRDKTVFSAKKQLQKWLPVDFYMIGPEHIVLHLLYSRFFTKFLRDQGYLNFDEPFMKMRHQGMILGPDGKKMSKSKGNVINPDEIVEKFGADTLRMYEMFMGPIETDKPWDTSSVSGNYRFLNRVYRLVQTWLAVSNDLGNGGDAKVMPDEKLQRKLHQTIKKVSHDIPALKFNTAIAAMMELINVWEAAIKELSVKKKENTVIIDQKDILAFIKILAPFAPFMAEELYQDVIKKTKVAQKSAKSIHLDTWPEWDEDLAREQQVSIAVQVNGKVRGEMMIAYDQLENKEIILVAAKEVGTVQSYLEGKKLVKEIYVPGKIVSLVVK